MARRPLQSPCLQCRHRKVRCDRRRNTCGSCERLQFNCSFRDDGERTQTSPPERKRATQACLACRRLKTRCSGELPECANCCQRERQCRYTARNEPANESLHAEDEGSQCGPIFPNRLRDMVETLDRFFRHIYPIPSFAFVHEPSTRKQYLEGTMDETFAIALAAVTNAFLSSDEAILDEGKSCIRIVEAQFWDHLHEPSIRRVQCLLFVIHYHIQTGNFARAYMLAGIAGRAATALRLNYERPDIEPVAQETRCRVLWALTSIDGQFSVGLPEHETMPYSIVYQQLPHSEESFSGSQVEPPRHPNLLAACFRLSKIQRDVMRLTRQLSISDKPMVGLPGLVQQIQNDLWRLHADLEVEHDFSISSTTQPLKMKDSRWFARYLLASLSWYQVHCDLYRIFLPGYAEAVPTVIMSATDAAFRGHAAEMCRLHVQQIFKILGSLLDPGLNVPLLSSYVAVCAYQSARLILFLPSSQQVEECLSEECAFRGANIASQLLSRFFAALPWARDIITDLRRLISNATYGIGASSVSTDNGRYRHDQLAVHSLLRQANFVDDDYEHLISRDAPSMV
ncbi:Zn(II)2Cys6 transcription factor [Aspergillus mulundensis]|uniref:Zn(2)-C6 fungal-type domain-containing protein n=1 Tax=Aspergillus mulundensis TaxID=1810919 RepID=A0A3D8SB73_9EURO|nr:Uncharacterized protein DSM5745_03892 [Aspergillus mulundensis]RDW83566.1 Uncharacterized protein DSM5745_03892 [Aspergillus mulundensis]